MAEVVPAIIPQYFADIEKKVALIKEYVDRVQVDVFDGTFSSSINWPYKNTADDSFEKLKRGEILLPFLDTVSYEIDITLARPEEHVEDWLELGVSALILHIESTDSLREIIARARERDVSVGIALSPQTKTESLEPFLDRIAFVQFMGNQKVGYHGVELDESVLEKIKTFHLKHPTMRLAVDIGVNTETAPRLVHAGISKLVSGSAIFKSPDIKGAIDAFHAIV